MRVVTAEEMRELERRAVAEYKISSLTLMQNAAHALANCVTECGDEEQSKVLVLCGPGNNGGDGMAAANMLRVTGHDVTALLCVEPNALKGDALTQYRLLAETTANLYTVGTKEYERTLGSLDDYDIIVDALLGTGSRGEPQNEIRRLVEMANDAVAYVIAADIPTGIDCDTGIASGAYITAAETVTFGLPKPFLFQNEGLTAAGDWRVADIGLPDDLVADAGTAFLLDHWWAAGTFPTRTPSMNKRDSGVVLVLAGCDTYPGAAVLACKGAVRAGAGLVKCAAPRWVVEGIRNTVPEVPVIAVEDSGGSYCANSIEKVIAASSDCDAIVVGPGLGRQDSVGEFLSALWKEVQTSWVVDADALYWMSSLGVIPKGDAVLTPHVGEASRLLGQETAYVQSHRMQSARELSARFGKTVVLKGAYTVIATPDYDDAYNSTGNPGLATAGTGDVLSGIVGALLAQRLHPHAAGALGAFWHGSAADMLAAQIGQFHGMSASDVAEALPRARHLIEAGELGQTNAEAEDYDPFEEFE